MFRLLAAILPRPNAQERLGWQRDLEGSELHDVIQMQHSASRIDSQSSHVIRISVTALLGLDWLCDPIKASLARGVHYAKRRHIIFLLLLIRAICINQAFKY